MAMLLDMVHRFKRFKRSRAVLVTGSEEKRHFSSRTNIN